MAEDEEESLEEGEGGEENFAIGRELGRGGVGGGGRCVPLNCFVVSQHSLHCGLVVVPGGQGAGAVGRSGGAQESVWIGDVEGEAIDVGGGADGYVGG